MLEVDSIQNLNKGIKSNVIENLAFEYQKSDDPEEQNQFLQEAHKSSIYLLDDWYRQ